MTARMIYRTVVLTLAGSFLVALSLTGCATAPLPPPPSPAEIAAKQKAAERAAAEAQARAFMEAHADDAGVVVYSCNANLEHCRRDTRPFSLFAK